MDRYLRCHSLQQQTTFWCRLFIFRRNKVLPFHVNRLYEMSSLIFFENSIKWNQLSSAVILLGLPFALRSDNIYFDQTVDNIPYLNNANSSHTEAHFFWIWVYMYVFLMVQFPPKFMINGMILINDLDFDVVNFPFLDGDVSRRTSYGVCISKLVRFARASSNLSDFNCRNKALTAKLLRQGYCYFKLRNAFSKFYRSHSAFVEKYNVSLKRVREQGISEPELYGDLVYSFRKNVGKI